MKRFTRTAAHSPWLFAACAALYLGLIGPWLISATSTLTVAAGIGLGVVLLAWALVLFGYSNNKGNRS